MRSFRLPPQSPQTERLPCRLGYVQGRQERGPGGATCPGPPKMFELYVFDVTKIKDSDITDGSWVRAMVTALKMQRNSVSERWSPKRETGAPNTNFVKALSSSIITSLIYGYIYDFIKGPKLIFCPRPHKTSQRPWVCQMH